MSLMQIFVFLNIQLIFLSNDGVYIVEDIYYKDQDKFIKYFQKTPYNFSIIDIYHKHNIANNSLLVVRKNHGL